MSRKQGLSLCLSLCACVCVCVCYVCLDFGHADGSCDVDLAEHDIPHAFLHLTLRAKALANKDGPFDTSDPFYTISRIDDAGSLAEEPVVVFVSTVRALV